MSNVEQDCVIENTFIGTFLIHFSANPLRKARKVVCPLCATKIKDGSNGRFFGCDYKFFPNSVCHPECVEKEGGCQATSERLRAMNDRFKQLKTELRNEFGTIGWFREGDGADA